LVGRARYHADRLGSVHGGQVEIGLVGDGRGLTLRA